MKVLLLSTYQQRSVAQHLLTGIRQRIGTCEYFALTEEQQSNIERFFNRSIRLSQFDRIVLEASQEWIYQQSLFLRQLPYLAVFSANETYSAKDKRLLKRNLHVMPWIRFVSTEHQLVYDLISHGYDAYWIRPAFDSGTYRIHRRAEQPVKCLIYGKEVSIKEMVLHQYSDMTFQFCKNSEELSSQLRGQDIFIYLTDDKTDFEMVIKALACGAIVLMSNPGAEACLRYHWRDNKNCIFVNNLPEALEKAQELFHNEALREQLVNNGLALAQRFTPEKVGEMLGAALEPVVRNSADYPRKTRIFGFEL